MKDLARMEPMDYRKQIRRFYTQDEPTIDALANYCDNKFLLRKSVNLSLFPLEDELHLTDWKQYQLAATSRPIFEVLKQKFIALNFPIQKGISQTNYYRNATLKGQQPTTMPQATGLPLENPRGITLTFQDGMVGQIPVLTVDLPQDFATLVQAFVYKNEPVPIPHSIGASIIKGINNWERLRMAIAAQQKQFPQKSIKAIQAAILAHKANYQDTFILVSKKPYSNIFPKGCSTAAWVTASLSIRIHHEYAHYLTLRLFGSMRNNMFDELLADYLGIHSITDTFDARLFLQFIGLENYPHYRTGGRLENYRGRPPLSDKGFNTLKAIIYEAALNIEKLDTLLGNKASELDLMGRFFILTQLGLLGIVSLFKQVNS